ncbi:hypothetical protein [Bacillus chungangensis]|uniref:Degradation enzyme regulation protein DegQ n=1 Tax=Bacillus chungangensis TaxID=587633 RepID=A0ABT9WYN7_9BACI|nr:hypothetical protein [Bacillus chungangensis]MDQ0178403.1 hypothetical protein [Bacillus chungangensis]
MAVENTEDLNYLKNQVERLDKEVYNLKSKIELLENLLIKIVDDQAISSDLLLDVDYIILKESVKNL